MSISSEYRDSTERCSLDSEAVTDFALLVFVALG